MDYHLGRINCGPINFLRRSEFPMKRTLRGQHGSKLARVVPPCLSASSLFGRCVTGVGTSDNEQPLVLAQHLDTDSAIRRSGLMILVGNHGIVGRS